jgi:hypothetical protein
MASKSKSLMLCRPRGSCYEVTTNGKKKSVARSLCGAEPSKNSGAQAPAPKTTSNAQTSNAVPPVAPAPPKAQNSGSAAAAETKVVKGNTPYIKGPKGGCYYVSESGRKEYVDRSVCQ